VSVRLQAVRNVARAFLLVLTLCALLGALGWVLGEYRVASIFVFGGLLAAAAVYWTADRVSLGLVGARELPLAAAPALHTALERLAGRARVEKPRL
jgi:hypothetical protein